LTGAAAGHDASVSVGDEVTFYLNCGQTRVLEIV
jgi:hypothetical protein